jgi:hypothetical protein
MTNISMSQDTAYQTIKYLQERIQLLEQRNAMLEKMLEIHQETDQMFV